MDCVICTEKINKVKHTLVTCCYCDFSACRTCCETYILDQTQPQCMNTACDKEWSRKFLVENFTKSFINTDWKKRQEKLLFDKEKALLPATQPIAEERKRKQKINSEIKEIDKLIHQLQAQKNQLRIDLYHIETESTHKPRERHFIRACPEEDCRGYLSTQWKCGLCEKHTCPDCHVVIGLDKTTTPHECNPDDLETAKLLDKDTKPCPKCSTGIFKIEGCDQMWCTQCHTAFSWNTGRIETRIHNPHYFEFMRRSQGEAPRNQADNYICGQDIADNNTVRILNRLVKRDFNLEQEEWEIAKIIQSIMHLREVQAPAYRVDDQPDNVEYRVDYLNGKTDEATFKKLIQEANKRHAKKREIYEILSLFQRTTSEIFLRMIQQLEDERPNRKNPDNKAKAIVTQHLEETEGIRKYANECLVEIARTYGGVVKEILFYNKNMGRILKAGSKVFTREVLSSVTPKEIKKRKLAELEEATQSTQTQTQSQSQTQVQNNPTPEIIVIE